MERSTPIRAVVVSPEPSAPQYDLGAEVVDQTDDHPYATDNAPNKSPHTQSLSRPRRGCSVGRTIVNILAALFLLTCGAFIWAFVDRDSWVAQLFSRAISSDTTPSENTSKPTPSPTAWCYNDPAYLFQTDVGNSQKCSWLNKSSNRQNKYCDRVIDGSKISASCRRSCGICS